MEITKEHIEAALSYVKEKRGDKERNIKFTDYCKTRGAVTYNSNEPFLELCNDSDCVHCSRLSAAFKEVVDAEIKKLSLVEDYTVKMPDYKLKYKENPFTNGSKNTK